jgi:CubicO group peptidase (beta-lactamase class C family)
MPDLVEAVVSQLSALVERGEVASVAFAVVAGTDVRSGGFGGVDTDSVFQIGSVTKAFTGLLLADSAARGEVKLSDPGTADRVPAATGHFARRVGAVGPGDARGDRPREEMGLGWHHALRDGRRVSWHNGMTGGYSSMIALDIERQSAIAALANRGSPPPSPLDAPVMRAIFAA